MSIDWTFQLYEQLDWQWREHMRPRWDGLTDDEYFWEPVPGTRFYTRNGTGLYERLTDQLFLRVDEVDETDLQELGARFANAFETRAPIRMVA